MNLPQFFALVRKYGLELDHLFETAYYGKYPICGWRQYKEKGKWPAQSLITFGGWSPTDWFDRYVGNFDGSYAVNTRQGAKLIEAKIKEAKQLIIDQIKAAINEDFHK